MCLFMWQRGAFEGVAWGYGAHFYNSIDNFQLPSRRFSIYTADFTVLLSFCLIYTFFFPVEEWFFETFPLAVRLLLLLRPVERRPRWNARKVDDKLPIDCSSPSVSFYLYVPQVSRENCDGKCDELSILWKC